MSRWQPHSVERLQQAALELFLERGYDRTTVADIADRAELTERTFFRYFADKREVLFAGSELFERFVVDALSSQEGGEPLEAVVAAYEAAGPALFDPRIEQVRRRHSVITANDELRERELKKGVRVAAKLTAVLVQRGIDPSVAALACEVGAAVFHIAFERWVAAGAPLGAHVRAALADLRRIVKEPHEESS